MLIREVIASKASQDVITITPDATVRELVDRLAEHNVGALIVSNDGTRVDGIVSERDVVRRLHDDESVLDSPVSAIMTAEVHTCETSHTALDLMQLMTEHRFRHVPVVEPDGALIGIISIGDVVKSRMSELEFERDQLDSYVHTSQT
ncbi:MAG: CBS domain-containing protein [Nocardioidaceae bacterium]